MCTVAVTGSNDQPTITWLGPMKSEVTAGVETTGSMSTLIFDPLAASHAGAYTCRATLGGVVETENMTVTVQSECLVAVFCVISPPTFDLSDPTITVSVSADPATPMAGSMLTLTCSVTGADMISPTINYQWSRNGVVEPSQMQQTWSFSSLSYSDAGQYSCAVDISSNILPSSINATSDLFDIILTCKSWHNGIKPRSRNIG